MSTGTKARKDWADHTAAIFIVGAVLVAVLSFIPGIRYNYLVAPNATGLYRVDRIFGDISLCGWVPGDAAEGTKRRIEC